MSPPLSSWAAPRTDRILVAGAFTQTLPSADGPVATLTLCRFDNLRRHTYTADLPAGLTWCDVVDDPDQRWLQRHQPPR